ncbi:hypothetical protein ISCGN_012789 [Ixodes scapularis]|uniref:Uncharacterized protein n=1 Tax=Ixodes scapularis TaxID=6945 RepID=B7PYA4_IXOSC|nr:hypothetical protein IscW_ISCW009038 [Ixodes scapularis]|eukprot:XP_002402776.1 hypothetical protein IscW_ISCW009038 [Ixodes scapularis]
MSSRKASCKRAPPCTRRVLSRELSVASSTSSYKRASFKGSHASFAMDDEPEPSAPPLELMDKVDGYEQASFDTGQ